jgi:hypothetical protein
VQRFNVNCVLPSNVTPTQQQSPIIIGKSLLELAQWLRKDGTKVEINVERRGDVQQLGLLVDGHFYPTWELADVANYGYLVRRDFESIRYRRVFNWSPFR